MSTRLRATVSLAVALLCAASVFTTPARGQTTTAKLFPEARKIYERAQKALVEGDYDAAEQQATLLLDLVPDFPPAYDIYRSSLRTSEKLAAAREAMRSATTASPQRVALWYGFARFAEQGAEREGAIARHVALAPESPWSAYLEAWIARGKQDYDKAQALYEKAHKLAPDEPTIAATLAGLYATRILNEEDSPKTTEWRASALRILDEIAKKAPGSYAHHTAFVPLVYTLSGKEKVTRAEQYLATFPNGPLAGMAHVAIVEDLGAKSEELARARARVAVAELAKRGGYEREMLYRRFILDPAVKQGQEAVDKLAAELFAANETRPELFYVLGSTYANSGEAATGVKLLTRAMEIAPKEDAEAVDSIRLALGRVYVRAGDTARAAETFQAITTQSLLADAAEGAGQAYAKVGDKAKAYDAYVRAVALRPAPSLEKALAEAASAVDKSEADTAAAVWSARDTLAKPAPDFTLAKAADGASLSLSSLKGKVVLLNFWFPG